MDKKKMGVLSLVLSLVSFATLLIPSRNLSVVIVIVIVGIILAVAGVVLGFKAKSEAKGLSVAGIIIGIISAGALLLALVGFFAVKNVTDCVDKGNGTATCTYANQQISVPTDYLKSSQYKK